MSSSSYQLPLMAYTLITGRLSLMWFFICMCFILCMFSVTMVALISLLRVMCYTFVLVCFVSCFCYMFNAMMVSLISLLRVVCFIFVYLLSCMCRSYIVALNSSSRVVCCTKLSDSLLRVVCCTRFSK